MRNLNLFTNLKVALDANNTQAGSVAFYTKCLELPLIEQYYMIKGFKLYDAKLFDETYSYVKSINPKFDAMLDNILTHIYNYSLEKDGFNAKDYQAAYKGMGSIQSYVDEIAEVL